MVATLALCGGGQAAAADNFIQRYIVAQGGCANTAASPLSMAMAQGNRFAPFGRGAADWSDADLALLKATLAACQATAAQTGNPFILQEIQQESDDLLARVPTIVAQAKLQAQAQAQQVEARRQLATARIDKAAQAKQQAKVAAETDAARLEAEATTAEAAAREAQKRLNERMQRADRARDEAKVKADAIASIERRAQEDAGTLPNARPAPPGELSELVDGDEAASSGKKAGPLTVTAAMDTPACKTLDEVATSQQSGLPPDKAGAAPSAAGTCRTLAKGTRATVQAAAAGPTTRALCVTLDGQPGCFWVAKAAFGPAAQ